MPAPPGRRYALPMLIEVLGLPDDRTTALEATLGEALAQLGLGGVVTVRRIEDPGAMIARGVRRPPALRVDGQGRLPAVRADGGRGPRVPGRGGGGVASAAASQPGPAVTP